MPVQKAKPTSPGRRFVVSLKKNDLHRGKPFKGLIEPKSKKGGRNNNGRITVRHQGGGHKRHYRVIDFKRNKLDIQLLLKELNTIQIDQQILLFLNMLMERGGTSYVLVKWR
jgi:large subunit ribosomal protein L2